MTPLIFLYCFLTALSIVGVVIYCVVVSSGNYPTLWMRKFRIVEVTNGYGATKHLIMFRSFIGIWHYLRGYHGPANYGSKSEAEDAIERIREHQERTEKEKTVSRKIVS